MMRHWRIGVILLAGVSSCVQVPECDLASGLEDCACAQAVNEALGAGGVEEGDWPSIEWWKRFEDPVLDGLIATALACSPTLERAEARLKAAREVALERRAKLYPEIDFDANDSWQHYSKTGFFRTYAPDIPAVVNDVTLGLSFSYEFDFWGKNRSLFHAALDRACAEELEKRQTELILTTSIAYSYMQLQLLVYKKQLLEERQENWGSYAAFRANRVQHALDTSMKWLEARSDVLGVQAMLSEIDQEIFRQIHRLKALSGMGQDASLEIVYRPIPAALAEVPKNLSLDLIARRPDLLAQKARLEAASKEIDAAKTDFYPNINLAAFLGLETVTTVFPFSQIFKPESFSGNAIPAIHLPIFTAGRLKAQLKEKVAWFNEAVYAYNELILRAAEEVATHLTTISSLYREGMARSGLLEVAQEQERHAARRFAHAVADRRELFETRDAALQELLRLADAEYARQLAGILLIRSLGGGCPDE